MRVRVRMCLIVGWRAFSCAFVSCAGVSVPVSCVRVRLFCDFVRACVRVYLVRFAARFVSNHMSRPRMIPCYDTFDVISTPS